MKLLKTLTLGLAALAVAASSASAQTTVYIAGSTAFRNSAVRACQDILGSGFKSIYVGSTLYKGGASVLTGTVPGHTELGTVTIYTYWTGSLAGVVDLVTQDSLPYFLNTGSYSSQLASSGTGPVKIAGTQFISGTAAYFVSSGSIQAAFTDGFQGSVANIFANASDATMTSPVGSGTNAVSTIPALAAKIANTRLDNPGSGELYVGIVPFAWAYGQLASGSTQPWSSLTGSANMTQQTAFAITNLGAVPLSYFTGNGSDLNAYVFFIGRNEDSGTRIDYAEEAQGVNPIYGQDLKQWQVTFSGTNQVFDANGLNIGGSGDTVASFDLWPDASPLFTEPSINWSNGIGGHSGYIAGGDIANVLSAANPVVPSGGWPTGSGLLSDGNAPDGFTASSRAYFVAGFGVSDTQSLNGGNNRMAYNGVPYSVQNVLTGAYSFWSFEHMYCLHSGGGSPSTNQRTVLNLIADKIYTADASTDGNGVVYAASAPNNGQAGILYNTTYTDFTGATAYSTGTALVTRGGEGAEITTTY